MNASGDGSLPETLAQRAERRSGALRGIQWLLIARFAVAAFIIAYILISARGWGATWATRTVYAVVTGVFALNAVYVLVLRTRADLETLKAVQIGIDIAVEALLVFLTGGVSSQMVVLFMFSVMGAALVLSWKAAVAFGAEAAALHVVATLIGLTRLSPEPAAPLREVLSGLFAQLVAFFAVALLSGLLSHRLSVARLLSRDILEAIGQGLIVADPADRILFSNAEARRLLGAEVLAPGRPLREALPPAAWSAMSFDAATGQGSLREFEVECPSGGKVPVGVTVRPALAGDDKPHGTLVVLTDRTLEKRFEEARSLAERSEAVSEMATAIAHELRNPLASMRGSVQEMARRLEGLEGKLPSDSKDLFQIVLSESDRLDAIISDFLAFAKMRPVNKGPCDIGQVLRESALILRQSAAEQGCEGIEVVVECEDELRCHADAQQLRQVLLNLGLNSIHAIRSAGLGAGAGRISLSARPCAFLDFPLGKELRGTARDHARGERAGVEIGVADNGCGMTSEVRRKAMTPFFTTKERGTGLGLAIVARIVKSHGGMIRIESEERRGTIVRFWLPAEGD